MNHVAYQPQYKNSWALVVGVNAYRYVSPLDYACNDADAVASVLTEELGFPAPQVTILKDGDATKQAILEGYTGLRDRASDHDDRVVIFFAGHGETVPGLRGPVGYLVPVDGELDKLSTLVRWGELTQYAELIPAKHILYIIDACYSGLALQRAVPPGQQRFIGELMQRLSRQVLTAGKADQTVADGGGPAGQNSIFTGYLVEGLRGAADADGVLTANLLMNYVYRMVGQDSRSNQTPHYGHFDGDGDMILRAPGDAHLNFSGANDVLVKTVEERPEALPETAAATAKPTFAVRNGYADPTSPNFGRNNWTERLGEARYEVGDPARSISRAFSWLSLIVEPTAAQGLTIDIAQELDVLRNRRTNDKQPPHRRFVLPAKSMTSIDSVCFYGDCIAYRDFWGSFLRLDKRGNIEYADTNCVFMDYADDRRFAYVPLIGLTWQFMFFAQEVLTEAGYSGGVRMLVNLVGTRDTILENFATGAGDEGRRWMSPSGSRIQRELVGLKCPTPHLQLEYKFVVGTFDEERSKEIIDDVAAQFGLAYNHQSSPRCFNYNTGEFPWTQYLNEVNDCRGMIL